MAEDLKKLDSSKKLQAEGKGKMISVTVKTSKQMVVVEVSQGATVEELKALLAIKFNINTEHLRLTAGNVLKDSETLSSQKIKDGSIVQLEIRSRQRRSSISTSRSSSASTTSPPPISRMKRTKSVSQQTNSNNFFEVKDRVETDPANNPDLMRPDTNNAGVQSILGNPDSIRGLFMSNLDAEELLENNPQFRQILTNPFLLGRLMELVSNPSFVYELMRNPGLTRSNPENIPMGFSTLQQNLFSGSVKSNNTTSTVNSEQGTASREPMAPQTDSTKPGSCPSNMPTTSGCTPTKSSTTSNTITSSYSTSNITSRPPMESFDEELTEISDFAENPDHAYDIPLLQGIKQSNQEDPEIERAVAVNPDTSTAILKIQEGVEMLMSITPTAAGLVPATQSEDEALPNSNTVLDPDPASVDVSDNLSGGLSETSVEEENTLPPEQRYLAQLEYLFGMGFVDKDINIQFLAETLGNLEATIDKLLGLLED